MKHIEFSSVANVIRLILISCTASENVYFNNRCTVVYVENNKNKNFIIIAVLSSDSMFYYGDFVEYTLRHCISSEPMKYSVAFI